MVNIYNLDGRLNGRFENKCKCERGIRHSGDKIYLFIYLSQVLIGLWPLIQNKFKTTIKYENMKKRYNCMTVIHFKYNQNIN